MEKSPGHQLDLFSDSQEEINSSPRRSERAYFSKYIWGYEKAILMGIILLVTAIVSFSLGVERGKRIQSLPTPQANIHTKPSVEQLPKEPEAKEQIIIPKTTEGVYTIQVASFKTGSYAQKEAELLKKRGYKTTVLNKGEYVILCVGNFSDKKQAQSLFLELRRYYKDCRIRRL